jgi:hypothetical protein
MHLKPTINHVTQKCLPSASSGRVLSVPSHILAGKRDPVLVETCLPISRGLQLSRVHISNHHLFFAKRLSVRKVQVRAQMGVLNLIISAAAGAVGAAGLLISLIRVGTVTVPVSDTKLGISEKSASQAGKGADGLGSAEVKGEARRKVRQTGTPNPDYKEGSKQPHPFGDSPRLELDPAELGVALYPFVISAVVPRPIAFISSLSKEVTNVSHT